MLQTLKTAIELLNTLSPIGLAGLLGFILWKQIQNNKTVVAVKDNHLHELPEMSASLGRIETLLQNMNDNIIYIRARVNGK